MSQFLLYSCYALATAMAYLGLSNQLSSGVMSLIYILIQVVFFSAMYYVRRLEYNFKLVKAEMTVECEKPMSERRTFMSSAQWGYVVMVYFTQQILSGFMPTTAYYVTTFITFIQLYVAMYPIFVESNIGFKRTGIVKMVVTAVMVVLVTLSFNAVYSIIIEKLNLVTDLGDSVNQVVIVEQLLSDPVRMFLMITFSAAFFEEVVFRGLGFRTLVHRNKIFAYIFTFVLFAFPHILTGLMMNSGLEEFIYLPIYGMMGFSFAYAYEYTGTIYTPMVAHFINNFMSFVAIYLTR